MDNLQPAQSPETKKFLEEECGLRPWKPTREPNYANPDKMECKSLDRDACTILLSIYLISLVMNRSHLQRCNSRSLLCWS